MTPRSSTPPVRASAPQPAGQESMSHADDFDGMVSEVQKAAIAEQELLSQPLAVVRAPWYRRATTAVMLAAVAIAVWSAQAVVWRSGEPQLSAHDRDAALRFTMAQQVARVEDFRAANGRLPASLTDVTEAYSGMSYAVVDSLNYRVTGTADGLALTFRSDSSLKAFLGGTVATIREHRK